MGELDRDQRGLFRRIMDPDMGGERRDSVAQLESYLETRQIQSILKSLVVQLCVHKPDRPVHYMIGYLKQYYLPAETERYTSDKFYGYDSQKPIRYGQSSGLELLAPSESIDDNTPPEKRNREMELSGNDVTNRPRRGAFSSCPQSDLIDFSKFTPKSPDELLALEQASSHLPLFAKLEKDEREYVYTMMFPVSYAAGDTIIRQGDAGDNFYIVASGNCKVIVEADGKPPQVVLHYGAGDSFGELALIYGEPRAATVVATTDVKLWGLERRAYRATLMTITKEKREKYGEFLHRVPLLSSLDRYERMVIADSLEAKEYKDGDMILKQGEVGQTFYLIISGKVRVTQRVVEHEGEVGLLGPGDYFGEIALLTDSPRKANCIAVGDVKCVYMHRADFVRAMGPLKDIVQRKMSLYKKYMHKGDEDNTDVSAKE